MRVLDKNPVLLFHCGTGSKKTPETDLFFRSLLPEIENQLASGTEAVRLAVLCVSGLEECGLFNAGRGAIPQADGVVRRDAGAMDGKTLDALGISQVEGIPAMARLVSALLGRSSHVHLSGEFVRNWAIRHGWSPEGRKASLPDPTLHWENSAGEPAGGTVGCVVRDREGNLAAVTSTGGIGRMWPGRIGDSPIVGGGFYADNLLGAISMTGVGESILKTGGGLAILAKLASGPGSPARETIFEEHFRILGQRFGGPAGGVGIDAGGRPFVVHSSSHMLHGRIEAGAKGVVSDLGHHVDAMSTSPP